MYTNNYIYFTKRKDKYQMLTYAWVLQIKHKQLNDRLELYHTYDTLRNVEKVWHLKIFIK